MRRQSHWFHAAALAALAALALLTAWLPGVATAGEGCTNDAAQAGLHSAAAEDVASQMIEAHGGLDAWRMKPTVSYKHTLVAPYEPDDPWVSVEVVDQRTRREYQDWPLDGSRIVSDGHEVWSVNWKRANPPKFMVNMAYYFINLPWLTQDDGVILEGPGEGTLPNDDKTYITLMMTFAAGTGDAPDDYYKIFIDPDTGLMKAAEYIVTYGAMLDLMQMPPEQTFMGPLTKVYDDYQTIDGLTVPSSYRTYGPDGNVYGEHKVENVSFSKKFDVSQLKKPAGAVVDKSSSRRAVASNDM